LEVQGQAGFRPHAGAHPKASQPAPHPSREAGRQRGEQAARQAGRQVGRQAASFQFGRMQAQLFANRRVWNEADQAWQEEGADNALPDASVALQYLRKWDGRVATWEAKLAKSIRRTNRDPFPLKLPSPHLSCKSVGVKL
jgi:hypothetical protein